jgi:hypothetical protein
VEGSGQNDVFMPFGKVGSSAAGLKLGLRTCPLRDVRKLRGKQAISLETVEIDLEYFHLFWTGWRIKIPPNRSFEGVKNGRSLS